MTLEIKHTFDEKNFRHYLNGFNMVLHCHHYMSLTTKLAIDFDDIGGTRILSESAEDSVRPLLEDYIRNHKISGDERLRIGAEFYSLMGMGKMEISGNAGAGNVKLQKSHVDSGWLKKWGNHDNPVNYFTRGYIAAVFGASFDKPARSYRVTENEAIVAGANTSSFTVEMVQV
ncbi:MAG: hypothetical protein LUQ25_07085 [Methanoregulaceae archaeon]|nr:hypothetical protein [Methanoregulaceae archaeon]